MALLPNNQSVDETTAPELKLPGFRFHPTEKELLDYYLTNMILGKLSSFSIITYLNIYLHDPWELPGKANYLGEREWYFFVPRDRKVGSGGRPNRTTERGFWKATGSDRKIYNLSEPKRVIGLRKTLVFYKGRAPRGTKTEWVMNEYRLPDNSKLSKELFQDIVLCKVYMKATSLKVLEQRMMMEADMRNFHSNASPMETCLSYSNELVQINGPQQMVQQDHVVLKEEEDDRRRSPILEYKKSLPEIQVPSKINMEWNTQDPLWMQLTSPWLQSLTPYHNILSNF